MNGSSLVPGERSSSHGDALLWVGCQTSLISLDDCWFKRLLYSCIVMVERLWGQHLPHVFSQTNWHLFIVIIIVSKLLIFFSSVVKHLTNVYLNLSEKGFSLGGRTRSFSLALKVRLPSFFVLLVSPTAFLLFCTEECWNLLLLAIFTLSTCNSSFLLSKHQQMKRLLILNVLGITQRAWTLTFMTK